MVKMKIISTAPTRIGLAGGGTDVEPFASTYGGKVLNMAINLRHGVTMNDNIGRSWCFISAMDKNRNIFDGIPGQGEHPEFDLIYEVVRSYKIQGGFRLVETFDGMNSAGLGSSASAAVALIGAFNRLYGIKQTRAEIAEKAWQMEINLGWVSGKQDQYASAFGGVNLFEFDNGNVYNQPIAKGVCERFVDWCLLVYTGKKRHSAKLQEKLRERIKGGQAIEPLKKIRSATWLVRDALEAGDFERVGKLIGETWELKKLTNPACTNKRINDFYDKAIKAGAIGGKVLGAGSEGHMLFIVKPSKRQKVVKALGLKEIEFGIDYNGLEVRCTD